MNTEDVDMRGSWLRGSIGAMARSLAFAMPLLAGLALLLSAGAGAAAVMAAALGRTTAEAAIGTAAADAVAVLCLAPVFVLATRLAARKTRRLLARWYGLAIPEPYRAPPAAGSGLRRRIGHLLTDPATRRDLLWTSLGGCVGGFMLLAPIAMTGAGLIAFIGSRVISMIPPPAYPGNSSTSILLIGFALVAAGLALAPWTLRGYATVATGLLAPAGYNAELEQRVRHLTTTRAETIDAGAAEIRRIERDLHDGAQARLVAMGMTLDAAGQLIEDDPKAARALLIEARDNSAKALRELRALVRGIHPPVLADRGLATAIRALALDSPLRIHLTSELDGQSRLSAPIESAAYFTVNELLANVTKHAQASQVWIDISRDDGILKIIVTDDGQGGADSGQGTGLRGIERRLAAFDGVLALSSPPGGPTVATLEIPCTFPGQITCEVTDHSRS
jgi:signal transduction histidine kinase